MPLSGLRSNLQSMKTSVYENVRCSLRFTFDGVAFRGDGTDGTAGLGEGTGGTARLGDGTGDAKWTSNGDITGRSSLVLASIVGRDEKSVFGTFRGDVTSLFTFSKFISFTAKA